MRSLMRPAVMGSPCRRRAARRSGDPRRSQPTSPASSAGLTRLPAVTRVGAAPLERPDARLSATGWPHSAGHTTHRPRPRHGGRAGTEVVVPARRFMARPTPDTSSPPHATGPGRARRGRPRSAGRRRPGPAPGPNARTRPIPSGAAPVRPVCGLERRVGVVQRREDLAGIGVRLRVVDGHPRAPERGSRRRR